MILAKFKDTYFSFSHFVEIEEITGHPPALVKWAISSRKPLKLKYGVEIHYRYLLSASDGDSSIRTYKGDPKYYNSHSKVKDVNAIKHM